MSLPWVKVYTRVLDDDDFRALSERAQHTYLVAIIQAGKCGRGGRLALRGGPMSIAQIANKTSIPVEEQIKALDELVRIGFLVRNGEEYAVERWSEFQGDISTDRVRRYREKKNDQASLGNGDETPQASRETVPETFQASGTETFQERKCNGVDIDRDKEEDKRESTTLSQTNLEAPRNLELVTPRARDESAAAALSPALDFAEWFVLEGLKQSAIPADRGLDVGMTVRRESLEDAAALLSTYGRDECERRAARLFEASKAHRIRRDPTIATLRATWGWGEIQGLAPTPRRATAETEVSEAGQWLIRYASEVEAGMATRVAGTA